MGNNIIEINGKRYDARSGTYLGDGVKSAIQHQHASHRGRVIDGFVKPHSQPSKATAFSPQVAPSHTKATAQTVVPGRSMEPIKNAKKQVVKRTPGSAVAHRKPEKSKTLMRSVVHKPEIAVKRPIKAHAASEIAAAPVSDLTPSLKTAAHNVDARRMARARTYARSRTIQRFTTVQQNYPVNRSAAARVSAPSQAPQHVTKQTQPAHNTAHNVQPPHSSHHTQRSHDLFEAAIANAKSHEQPEHKLKKTGKQKAVGIMASVAAFLVISGFIGYMNMSTIEMRVASVRAGFSAQLPGYVPNGYAMSGGVKAQRGVVATTYRSGDSSYTIQQQASDWDSQTLYDNVVAMSSEKHQTLEGQGRTVYVYGNNAAWVNGGVLYSVKTNGSLPSDQILSIATSM